MSVSSELPEVSGSYYEIDGPYLGTNYHVRRILAGRCMAVEAHCRTLRTALARAKGLRTADSKVYPERSLWPVVRSDWTRETLERLA